MQNDLNTEENPIALTSNPERRGVKCLTLSREFPARYLE